MALLGSTLGEVLVAVGVDTKGLQTGLAKAKGETESAGTTMSKFGGIATVAFAAAGVAAIKFGVDAVHSAEEHERVLTQLKIAVGDNTAAFETQATALQNLTGFQDEEVLAADTVLARFKLTNTEITNLTPLVLDYARATGTDAASAAGSLGKALLGNTRALKTIGIDFTATGDKAKDLASISKLLEDRVGGASEAFGRTFQGKLAIVAAKFDDIKEAVGAALIPALEKLVTVGSKIIELVGPLLAQVFEAVADTVADAVDALGPLVDLLDKLIPATNDSADSASNLSKAWHFLTQVNLVEFFTGLTNELRRSTGMIDEVDIASATYTGTLGDLKAATAASTVATKAETEALKAQKEATKALQQALPGLIGSVLSLRSAQKELHQAQGDASVSSAELKQKELAVVEAFLSVKGAFADIVKDYKDGKATIGDVIEKFQAQAHAAGLTRSETRDLIGTIQEYINKLNAIPSSVNTNITTTNSGTGGTGTSPQQMASGGIVRRPTFALIGESGPEAVIPLGRGGGIGSTIVINIAGSVISEGELMKKVRKAANIGAARNALQTGF